MTDEDGCCAFGHKLVAVNRYSGGNCRACARARQYCYIRTGVDFEVEAGIYYRLIMMGKGHKDRRYWSKTLRKKIYPEGYKEAEF